MRARRGRAVVLGAGAMVVVAAAVAVVAESRGDDDRTLTVGEDVSPRAPSHGQDGSSASARTTGPTELPSAGMPVPGPTIPAIDDVLRQAADAAIAGSAFIDRISGGASAELVAEGPWTSSDQTLLGIAREYRLDTPVDTALETWPWVDKETGAAGRPDLRLQVSGLRVFDVLVSTHGDVVEVSPVEHDGTE